MSDLKRPPQDNRRGIHGPTGPGWAGGEQGIEFWIGELQALGVRWVKLVDDGCSSLALCRRLVTAGIFPVVRILRRDPPPYDGPEPNPGHLNAAEEETIKKLLDVGVLYFETNNEPDTPEAWKEAAFPDDRAEAARLVALNWLFDAHFILEAGGYPGLPAVRSGGSLDLLEALVSLEREKILLDGCWLAVHNYGLNRPLDYPLDAVNRYGQPLTREQYERGKWTGWSWWNPDTGCPDTLEEINRLRLSEKNEHATRDEARGCFREYERFDGLVQARLGRPIPILSTEGGFLPDRRPDRRYPRVTPYMHAELTVAMYDYMQRNAPEQYYAVMPLVLVPSPGSGADAWYGDFWTQAHAAEELPSPLPPMPLPEPIGSDRMPVVDAVKGMGSVARPNGGSGTAPVKKPLPPPFKPPTPNLTPYIVQRGDTLKDIAGKFHTSVTVIAEANNIADPSRVTIGSRILVPGSTAAPPPPPMREASTQPAPPPAPKFSGMTEFDPRLGALGIELSSAIVAPGMPYWKLVRAVYEDAGQAGNTHNVFYIVLDEQGGPAGGQRVMQTWAEGKIDAYTDGMGNAVQPLWLGFNPERGEPGPYTVWVDGLPSDRVIGVGLPHKRNVNFRLTWQKTVR